MPGGEKGRGSVLGFPRGLDPSSVKLCYANAKSLQLCPTLCDPIDGSPPGSAVPGILQARILEWVAISFSNAWKWKVKVKSLSRAWLSATPWTAAYQAPPSMGFSRQEYWMGCHCLLRPRLLRKSIPNFKSRSWPDIESNLSNVYSMTIVFFLPFFLTVETSCWCF